jgi:hypothetical protein
MMTVFICSSILIGSFLIRRPIIKLQKTLQDMSHQVAQLNNFFNRQ